MSFKRRKRNDVRDKREKVYIDECKIGIFFESICLVSIVLCIIVTLLRVLFY